MTIGLATRGYISGPPLTYGVQVAEVEATVEPGTVEATVEIDDEVEVTVVMCDP